MIHLTGFIGLIDLWCVGRAALVIIASSIEELKWRREVAFGLLRLARLLCTVELFFFDFHFFLGGLGAAT